MEVKIANYGQERDRYATEGEIEIFEILKKITKAPDLELVRVSDDYVTAKIGDWDLARIKCTNRAKWIIFPIMESGSKKNRIQEPEDVNNFSDLAVDSLAHIRKYSV